jgi:hypothetical protein
MENRCLAFGDAGIITDHEFKEQEKAVRRVLVSCRFPNRSRR